MNLRADRPIEHDTGHTPVGPGADWEIPGHVPATPFRIRVVRTEAQLARATRVRHDAYADKLAELADKVRQPGLLDREHEPLVLLAENLDTGEPVGTVRINLARSILDLMPDIDLPDRILRQRVAFVSRMAATGSSRQKRAVRDLIQKSIFQIAFAKQIPHVLILAVPPRERLFQPWGFEDVFADGQPRRPAFMDGVAVRVLVTEIFELERRWRDAGSSLHDYVFRTFHPEIEVFASVLSQTQRSGDRTDPTPSIDPMRPRLPPQRGRVHADR